MAIDEGDGRRNTSCSMLGTITYTQTVTKRRENHQQTYRKQSLQAAPAKYSDRILSLHFRVSTLHVLGIYILASRDESHSCVNSHRCCDLMPVSTYCHDMDLRSMVASESINSESYSSKASKLVRIYIVLKYNIPTPGIKRTFSLLHRPHYSLHRPRR